MPKFKKQKDPSVKEISIKSLAPSADEPVSKDTPNVELYGKGVKDGIGIAKKQLLLGQPVELIKGDAFNAGVRYVLEVAEGHLAKSLGLKSRQELANHGDLIPAWWVATLFGPLWYGELSVSSEKPVPNDSVK